MPREARKAKFVPFLLLLCSGIAYYVYTQNGISYVNEQVPSASEAITSSPRPAHPPTALQGLEKSYTVGGYAQTFVSVRPGATLTSE